ncbi:MAG: hypothetical protein WC699_11430 [Bacteroidales bacterium]|jgi:hypothetical protein
MTKIKILTWLGLATLLAGCETISFQEYEIPPYDGAFTWTQVTANAQWSNRIDFPAVAYKNKLWIFGGYYSGEMKGDTYHEDVWNSADGKTWEPVQDSAPWMGRRGHTVTVFDDGTGEAMFLIGGFTVNEATGYRQYTNDVWKSTDGASWTQVKARTYPELDSLYDFFPRMNHAVVVASHGGKKYMYLIGGSTMMETGSARYAMKYFNDVWRSADGIHWEDMHSEDYGIRAGHAVTVDPATGTIYVQGGNHGIIFGSELSQGQPLPDWHWLWSTNDGKHWIAENDTAEFSQGYLYRAEHQMAFYNNTLYAFPGCTNNSMHFHFALAEFVTMWKREPGNIWSVDSKGSDTDARYSYGFVEFDHKIWILGGDTNKNGPANDVWYSEIK